MIDQERIAEQISPVLQRMGYDLIQINVEKGGSRPIVQPPD